MVVEIMVKKLDPSTGFISPSKPRSRFWWYSHDKPARPTTL